MNKLKIDTEENKQINKQNKTDKQNNNNNHLTNQTKKNHKNQKSRGRFSGERSKFIHEDLRSDEM